MSRYVNGVAKRHGEISRLMFTGYHIDAITNGVHAATWASPHFQALYDRHITDWRQDNFSLRHAESIPEADIWEAHTRAKAELLAYVNQDLKPPMKPEVFTIGFARRVTAYKRADLLFSDLQRLKEIALKGGGLQLVFAGKAHPSDQEGKRLIRRILELKNVLRESRRRSLAQHSASAPGGVWDQWDEGCAQRHSQLEHRRRLVDGRTD